MSFKDGRIGVGKDPIFPLDVGGSCRIDGDLILGGRFSDSQGNPIQLGSGSGTTSIPDQTKVTLPSWEGGTITTQGLGIFKGKQDSSNSTLYITGDTSLPSSATGANNTTLGFGTGTDITSGSHNVLIGKDSGANITTGNSNTVIGRSAGQELTTGSENVMIGVLAGHAYNSGRNILIGHYAGFALSNTQGYNIAIGYNAMQQCESYPTHNICMGHSAGLWGGGDNSIFIGREAGKGAAPVSSNSGNENIGIGHSALLKIKGGEHNICIGYEAGSQNTAGLHNVCIGRRSGANITNNYNTLIGGNSGQGMTTAYQNTVVGYEAYNCSGLPGTRNSNVFIGMQSGYRVHCDNNVGIGYRALFNKKANVCTAIGYQCMGDGSPDSDHVGYNTGVGCNVLRTVSGSSTNQGCYNTVMGHHAAYNLTTGYKNVIIGSHAANNNTHLNQSVVIGHYAGYNFTNSTANVVIGIQAGMSITTGSQNILLGYQAGYNITNGTYNCAMGYNAMNAGAGSYNVALGDNAMGAGAHTSKNNNVAIGYQALYMATHGNLVAVGHQAGLNNSSGQQNTFIGYQSGKSTTTSSNNTFVGYEAGMSNTSSQNTFVGQGSGRMTTSGFDNTAVGYYSLYKNTSGYGNNAMGYYCLYSNTTGDYNVAIGVGANQYNTTGNNNIAIGVNANQYVQTRSHNITIGAYAGAGNSTSATGSDYALHINSHNGYYGEDSFIYGDMNMSSNPFIRFNCDVETSSYFHYTSPIGGLVGDYPRGSGVGDLYPIFCLNKSYIGTDGDAIPKYSVGYCYPPNCDVPGTSEHSWGMYIDGTSGSPSWNAYANWFLSGTKDKWSYMQSGRLGIGTTSPKYPLDVMITNTNSSTTYWNAGINDGASYSTQNDTSHWGTNTGQGQIGDLDSGTDATYGINAKQIAAHFKNAIWVSHGGGLLVSSDERIKTNIIDVPDDLALETVRNIPCRFYNYKDTLERGLYKTIGFIAQEVKKILPMAVSKEKRFIPNVLRKLTNISWEEITDNSSNQYKLITDLSECSGVKYKFYVNDGENEIRKEVIGNSDNSFTFDTSYNNVFCYGKEVDDFHTLDKNKLFALNFSATQELDKKVTALETVGNQDHNVKILDLYKENQELKARLAKIEAFLGI